MKANVLFFDKKPPQTAPVTKEIWVYDLRSNRSFSIRQTPIQSEDLSDFVRSYAADDRTRRSETPHFHRFGYSEIIERDRANLDFQWQEQTDNAHKETPQILMKEILKDLDEAIREFALAEAAIQK